MNALPESFDKVAIAVCVPCYNEELTIGSVVTQFAKALPTAKICVYNNNSSDRTVEEAARAGAILRHETRQGKGNVVRRMFADIEADVYVMVDGDDTYDAGSAARMVDLLLSGPYDLVNGLRQSANPAAYRPGHKSFNILLTEAVGLLFGRSCKDMLSGYKVMSRRFVKSFPLTSQGFDIETELLVHALETNCPVAEIATPYRERPKGSASKLNTIRDGLRIIWKIFTLLRREKPLLSFGVLAAALATLSLILGIPVVDEFISTGLVPRVPTAILAASLGILSAQSLFAGLVLDLIKAARDETKQLRYLSYPAPGRTTAASCMANKGSS